MPVEVGEQVGNVGLGLALLGRAALQVVDDRLGVDLLLDVERRHVDDEVGPVLPVLAAPDELRVGKRERAGLRQLLHLLVGDRDPGAVPDQLGLARLFRRPRLALRQRPCPRIVLRRPRRRILVAPKEALHLRRRDVPAGGLVVLERIDLLGVAIEMGRTGHQAGTFVSS